MMAKDCSSGLPISDRKVLLEQDDVKPNTPNKVVQHHCPERPGHNMKEW